LYRTIAIFRASQKLHDDEVADRQPDIRHERGDGDRRSTSYASKSLGGARRPKRAQHADEKGGTRYGFRFERSAPPEPMALTSLIQIGLAAVSATPLFAVKHVIDGPQKQTKAHDPRVTRTGG
jgi:hypothetical protein